MLERRRWGIYMDLPQQKPQQFNHIGATYEAFFAGFCGQQLHLAACPSFVTSDKQWLVTSCEQLGNGPPLPGVMHLPNALLLVGVPVMAKHVIGNSSFIKLSLCQLLHLLPR